MQFLWKSCIWIIAILTIIGCENSVDIETIQKCHIIAHRGGTANYPENSLAAINNAISIGVDAVELDIRLSKDGTIIVCHDADVARTTNEFGLIKDLTSDTLSTYNLLYNGKVTKQSIPTLEEVLSLVNKRVWLYIEIKEGSIPLEKELINLLNQYDYVENVSIISFDYQSLKRISEYNLNIDLRYLFYNTADSVVLGNSEFSHISGFILDHYCMNKEIVDKIKRIHKSIDVYVLNDIKDMPAEYYNWIDGIISDDPQYWMNYKYK